MTHCKSQGLVSPLWLCPTLAVGQPLCIAVFRGGLPCPVSVRGRTWLVEGAPRPCVALPAPSIHAAFQDADMTSVRPLKRKAQERQVQGDCWDVAVLGAGAEVGSLHLCG